MIEYDIESGLATPKLETFPSSLPFNPASFSAPTLLFQLKTQHENQAAYHTSHNPASNTASQDQTQLFVKYQYSQFDLQLTTH